MKTVKKLIKPQGKKTVKLYGESHGGNCSCSGS